MTENYEHYPFKFQYGTPEQFRGQPYYMEDENTLVIGGAKYNRVTQGHACGMSNSVIVFSGLGGGAVLLSHPPYCGICATCWHPVGTSIAPDWAVCGTPVGGAYGFIVTFPSFGWLWICMGKIGYVPTSFP